MTPLAIERALHIKSSNLVGMLRRLESSDLITRSGKAGDRRTHSFTISGTGEERLAAASLAYFEIMAAVDALWDKFNRELGGKMLEALFRSQKSL